MNQTEIQAAIAVECDAVKELLLRKNREYGSAAFEPINVFSGLTAEQQIAVRIDDKLQRLRTIRKMAEKGEAPQIHEDTELDLTGYLILLMVARRLRTKASDSI